MVVKALKIYGTLISLGASVLSLSGCGPTVAQGQAQAMGSKLQEIRAESTSCAEQVAAKPELAPLSQRMNLLDASKPNFSQKTDAAKPSRAEVALLVARFQQVEPCKERTVKRLREEVNSALAAVVEEQNLQADNVVLVLVQGKATWGEANQEWARIKLENDKKWVEVAKAIAAGLNAEHQREVASRAALVAAIADAGAQAARGRR